MVTPSVEDTVTTYFVFTGVVVPEELLLEEEGFSVSEELLLEEEGFSTSEELLLEEVGFSASEELLLEELGFSVSEELLLDEEVSTVLFLEVLLEEVEGFTEQPPKQAKAKNVAIINATIPDFLFFIFTSQKFLSVLTLCLF